MAKTLVIVESPAKAKTIGSYLGKDFKVVASVGHVRDLPASTLGVNVKNSFKPMYITMRGKEKVIKEIKQQASKVERVLIATDPDREGEAIAWHLAHILKIDPQSRCRVTFNAITKNTVNQAVNEPRAIDMQLVNAQQARRILDRLVGYELSPLLWQKIQKGLSAGRVQSVATRLTVLREREIKAFKPEEYWLLNADFKTTRNAVFGAKFYGQRQGTKAEKIALHTEAEVEKVKQKLQSATYTVAQVQNKEKKRQATPPFTTSTMQQQASRSFGFAASRTMSIAQRLYEGISSAEGQLSLITYMRTDSVRISPEALNGAREYIKNNYGEAYLPTKPNFYRTKKSSQDAHECIRPVHLDLPPHKVQHILSSEQFKLYSLIWNKFISSQMTPALYDSKRVEIDSDNGYVFSCAGDTLKFPGWLKIYGYEQATTENEAENIKLPELLENEEVLLQELHEEQKFTQPPARYTEANLIKALEELGIGRPSTYAPTISTIINRNYVEREGQRLAPTELGTLVTELLEAKFSNIVDTTFTADIENRLDNVEEGEADWIALLSDFYPPFHKQVEEARESVEKLKLEEEKIGEKCPQCGEGELVIKQGRYGKFIACDRFPECDYSRPYAEKAKGKCPLCGSGLLKKRARKGKRSTFYVCDKQGKDPNCEFISWNLPVADKKCDLCGSYLVEKTSRGKTYHVCSNDQCPNKRMKPETEIKKEAK